MATQSNEPNTPYTPAKPAKYSVSSTVRVIVRVRPFLLREISDRNGNPTPCVSVLNSQIDSKEDGEEVTVHLTDTETSRNECYKLDSFFGQEDNNVNHIFQKEVSPLIPEIFYGTNATVFAYGATGSGKTFTMQGSEELPGLMPLAMSKILSQCSETGSGTEISYYEVYMDRCYDLLEPKPKEISVLDDKDGKIHLKGLSNVPVKSMSDFQEAYSCAIQRRKVAHTDLNDVSSRSHGVLVVTISTPCNDGSSNIVTGKLNLIDLAGNEDNRRSHSEGVRLQESAKINQSLFALSNVIYALNNNEPRVPYRESKLTRILQDSLGGTSRALMVACLNPGEYQESVYTVKLAARSRHITNFVPSNKKQETPKGKVDMEAKLQGWLASKGKTKNFQNNGAFGSPFIAKTPGSYIKSTTKQNSKISAKAKPVKNQTPFVSKENKNEELNAPNVSIDSEARTEGQMDKNTGEVGSFPIRERIKALEILPRKVLSPVNSNINIKNMSSKDQIRLAFIDPTTPKTPFLLRNVEKNSSWNFDTPLSKFATQSSNLKSCLLQEYIEFLNGASKEELLELKGIGLKMAEYILELRKTSPLKSINDLEKIGLSSKQVYKMFGKTAKGLFD